MGKYRVHQKDRNHDDIRLALQAAGATVVNDGPLDLVVGFRGRTFLLEVKTATGKLRASQERFLAGWRGHAAVVRDYPEALKAIGAA